MKTDPNKKPSKDWEWKKLGECVRLINGRAYLQHELLDSGTPIIRIQNLNGGNRWYYSNLILPEDKYCQAGDLLFAWSASFGPYVWKGEKSIYHYHIWRVDPFDCMDRAYAFRMLEWITEKVKAASHGVAMLHMTKSGMEAWEIPLPPLPEQRRFAAILDQADQLRVKRREALAELDRLTQSIFVEMFGDVVRNDKGWSSFSVGELTNCIVPGRDKPKSFSGNIPWVTTEDLCHLGFTDTSSKGLGLSAFEIAEVGARVIPTGSVIISCVGNLGISSIAAKDIVINQQLHSYQCHPEINNVFLMYCLALQSNYMYARASSTTLPYMNKTVCNSIPIVVPPIELQEEFSKKVQKIRTHKEILESSQTALNSLFTSLQHRAFRGEL